MSNVGRIINDCFCNGFFSRDYDLDGSEIIAEGDSWIVIKKRDGSCEFGDFQIFEWNRNEDGSLSGGISNVGIRTNMQEFIDAWCNS